jgi:hypothetical protein
MDYFKGCANLTEAKARRNQLVCEFHPDNTTRIMQEINAGYEQARRDALPDSTLPAAYHAAKRPDSAPQPVIRERVVIKEVIKVKFVEVTIYVKCVQDPPWSFTGRERRTESVENDRTCDYSADYFE